MSAGKHTGACLAVGGGPSDDDCICAPSGYLVARSGTGYAFAKPPENPPLVIGHGPNQIRLDKTGFHFRGELIEDAGKAYDAFLAVFTGRAVIPPAGGHRLNGDQTVAVSTDVYINPDMSECPRGVKVQLEGAGGVLLYGIYDGKDPFFVGWAPVPRRRPA